MQSELGALRSHMMDCVGCLQTDLDAKEDLSVETRRELIKLLEADENYKEGSSNGG